MIVTFIIFLCLLPFSHFLFRTVDVWLAQTIFAQLGIVLFICMELWKDNKPLATLLFWVSGLSATNCISFHNQTHSYSGFVILPYFNFLLAIIFYWIVTRHIRKEDIYRLAKYFSIVLLVICIFAILQRLNLDQFYKSVYVDQDWDYVVGTIGNPLHFGHFLVLTMLLLFLLEKRVYSLGLCLLLFIIYLTGTTSSMVIALGLLMFYLFFHRLYSIRVIVFSSIVLGVLIFLYFNTHSLSAMLEDGGRFENWKEFYPHFQLRPITGRGLGAVNNLAETYKITTDSGRLIFRHMHNEFYHFAIETGLISIGIILWGIIDYFRKFCVAVKDKVTVCMVTMFIGFLLCCLVGFPAHLWVLAVWGILGYAYIYRRTNENKERD